MPDGAVGSLIAPVVDNVVSEIRHARARDFAAEITGNVVDNEIVVKGQVAVAHHDGKAVDTLVMTAPGVCGTDHGILHGIVGVVGIQTPLLIRCPADGAVIDHAVRALGAAPCIVAGAGRLIGTRTGAEVAADDIIPAECHLVVLECDARAARCRLTGNGHIAHARYRALQFDGTADVEYNDSAGFADRIAERTRAAVIEVGDVIDLAAASAGSILAAADSARKCENPACCIRPECRLECDHAAPCCHGSRQTRDPASE